MDNPQTPAPTFLYRCLFDGNGGARELDDTDRPDTEGGTVWIHIDVADEQSCQWLLSDSGVDHSIAEALLEAETRPRSFSTDDGMLVVLRGVNTNPGEDLEDMVSVRVWIERSRIITTRRRRLLSVVDIRDRLAAGRGPRSPGSFLSMLTGRLADRIGDFVDAIEDSVSEQEESLAGDDVGELRQSVADVRRQIASVRRFLAPQRDALDRLYRNPGTLLSESEIQELREESDRTTRYLEDLDLARERAMVLREEFLGRLAQEQNSRMYVLSVVAAIFLPLTFVTGLLGMNVGGLPGLDSPNGFLASLGLMVAAAFALAAFFRWKKWL